jgi:hypothetical protein
LLVDVLLRSLLFSVLFGSLVVSRRYAEEVNTLWNKWSRKPLNLIKK